MVASWLLVTSCADDDPFVSDAEPSPRRDAGAEDDAGAAAWNDLRRQLDELQKRQQELEQRLMDLIPQQPSAAKDVLRERLARPLLAAVCAHTERCCDRDELALLLGESVASATGCESVLLEVVPRGSEVELTPSDAPIFGLVRELIARPGVPGLSVDSDAVAQCAEYLRERACEPPDLGRCQPPLLDDPCAPAKLLRGALGIERACDPSSLVPQCAPELVCRPLSDGAGFCATPSGVGDRCIEEADCRGDELYCKAENGQCERRKQRGESCKYHLYLSVNGEPSIDSNGHQNNPTLVEPCARGLACAPYDNICVEMCKEDAPCDWRNQDNQGCVAGLVCRGEFDHCGPTAGRECGRDSECSAGEICTDIMGGQEGHQCIVPVPLGGLCVMASPLSHMCAEGYCKYDYEEHKHRCSPYCKKDADCGASNYCTPSGTCEPTLLDGSLCAGPAQSTPDSDHSCASGYCDATSLRCTPRVATNAACDSGRSAQCPDGQYCESQQCKPIVSGGGDCAGFASSACGPDSFCRVSGAAHSCTPIPNEGDDCEVSSGLVCPQSQGLECIDGHCWRPSARPLETTCSTDAECTSGFCHFVTHKCAQRGTSGAACSASADRLRDDCEPGLYCVDKCVPRMSAGALCKPALYRGRDCFAKRGGAEPGQCLVHGEARCGPQAYAAGKALCDGLPR